MKISNHMTDAQKTAIDHAILHYGGNYGGVVPLDKGCILVKGCKGCSGELGGVISPDGEWQALSSYSEGGEWDESLGYVTGDVWVSLEEAARDYVAGL